MERQEATARYRSLLMYGQHRPCRLFIFLLLRNGQRLHGALAMNRLFLTASGPGLAGCRFNASDTELVDKRDWTEKEAVSESRALLWTCGVHRVVDMTNVPCLLMHKRWFYPSLHFGCASPQRPAQWLYQLNPWTRTNCRRKC